MSRIDNIKKEFLDLPEVKRIKELEPYIDSNKEIKNTFEELKTVQRKMVIAEETNDMEGFKHYNNIYNNVRERLLDLPFVEEYLELVEMVDDYLKEFTSAVEGEINRIINK